MKNLPTYDKIQHEEEWWSGLSNSDKVKFTKLALKDSSRSGSYWLDFSPQERNKLTVYFF